jgi:lipopolysaccharide/colanic/teichoic acid biosynthesis glycosyltransferase
MVDAPGTRRRYASVMRDLREQQLFRRANHHDAQDQMRRLMDFVMAAMLLAITAALMLLIALTIRAESTGPIFVKRTCIGLGGRRFEMLKFRTLVHDPEHTIPLWARKPSRVGQVLRYTRLDALPQLINVMRGEMSIIDPDGRSPSFLD